MSVYVGLCVCLCVCVSVCSSRKEAGVCAEWEVCAEFRAVHSKLQLGARPPIMKLQVGALTYNLDQSTL